MCPALRPGDTLILSPVLSTECATGDIVCIPRERDFTTHRVIEIDRSSADPTLITKGDNLPYFDSPIVLSPEGIHRVAMIYRAGRRPTRPRFGRTLVLLSRKNLTVGIIQGRIGRLVRRTYGRVRSLLNRKTNAHGPDR
jgi:hypothetical protein